MFYKGLKIRGQNRLRWIKLKSEFLLTSSFWRLEKRSSGNLKIPLDVKDQLAKLMNCHPEFAACAGTTAAFFTQSRK